ncbi:MAG: heavy metal translocating P-type ATPase metal-binding domain-containing protein [Planctomycetota bacterium]
MRLRSVVSGNERSASVRTAPGQVNGDAAGSERCTHCGLLVPADRRSSSFCCAGCEAVHGLLQQEGLTRFYALGGAQKTAVGTAPRVPAFDWLPEMEASAVAAAGGGSEVVRLSVDVQGIRCAACVWLLRALWQRVAGGVRIDVSPSLGRVTLTYRSGSGAARAFAELAARLGYPMAPPSRRVERDTGLLLRLGICAAVAMNAMILAVSLYFGLDSVGSEAREEHFLRTMFGWVLLGLGSVSLVAGGPVFFRSALAGVRAGVVHMDLPISVGILMAYGGSVIGQLTGGDTWFDTLAIFVAFMLGGRFLQQRTLARSRDQVLADDGAEHLRARCVRDGEVQLVPIQELRVGDELIVAPGDLVPTRGVLLGDANSFSLDWINGESEPRRFAAGSEIPAGAFHAGLRAVRMKVQAGYVESGLADLLSQEPVDREDTHGRVVFWDRLNRYYAIGVLLAAAIAAGVWACIDPARALPVAVAVLVVTCPCAMGIATPLAFHLTLAGLRRRGVFVRTKSLLDKVRMLRHVVFDKTGTVTFGGLRATVDAPIDGHVLPVLASLASASNHPVSLAVLEALPSAPVVAGMSVAERIGEGLEATWAGSCWRLGSAAFATRQSEPEAPSAARQDCSEADDRQCVLTRDGEVVVRFRIEEDYRSGVREEMRALQERGLDVHLMSGDQSSRVARAADRLGLPRNRARGGMSPQDKAAAVVALGDADTMMVGDGLNDAPAFAAAYCAGTPAMDRPVLPARSDFCFRGAQAGAVVALCEFAERHARVVRTNLALALAYNASVLSLSFLGVMTPLLCAVLMPISSVALVLHTSLRLKHREFS